MPTGAKPSFGTPVVCRKLGFWHSPVLPPKKTIFLLRSSCTRRPDEAGIIVNQAFYFACKNGKLEVADYLLSQGVEINSIVPGLDANATVLHWVTSMNARAESVIRFLLARGADASVRDDDYHATPADWARYQKRDALAELLESHVR
jgi:ankyrin repeat protein